jgi:oligopeptidase B
MKSFEDFIACAELLVASGRTTPGQMSMEGRSAGGLLMGSVLNMRPDLFRAVIAGVPFVDVCNTMSDATIPLTKGEICEWGQVHQHKYFTAMSAYCPYQNVKAKPYPAVLALAGLHDPRVLYSEPAKWVAKLREYSTSDRDILLKVDMDAGHFSASDRYHYKRERAFEMAWLLDQMGAPEKLQSNV